MITVWITRELDLVFREENSNIYYRTYYSRLRHKVGNKRYRINEKKLGRMKGFIVRSHCFPPDVNNFLVVCMFDVLYFSDIKKLIEDSSVEALWTYKGTRGPKEIGIVVKEGIYYYKYCYMNNQCIEGKVIYYHQVWEKWKKC